MTRKTAGIVENLAHQQTPFGYNQMKVVISSRQIHVYNTDLLPLKILVTLTMAFQGHSRSNVMVSLNSPYGFLFIEIMYGEPNHTIILDLEWP